MNSRSRVDIGDIFGAFFFLGIPFSIISTGLIYLGSQLFLVNHNLHKSTISKIKEEISQLGLEMDVIHDWEESLPAVFSLDTKNKLILINSDQTKHLHLIIPIKYILAIKIERNLDIQTSTSSSGRVHIPVSDNVSYSVGGGTESTSSITEHPVLEIHYQLPEDTIPSWINIPFENNRQKAESIILAINRLTNFQSDSKDV